MVFGRDLAEIYNDLYETLGSRKRIYSEVLNFFKQSSRGRVLDVGCGTGKLSQVLNDLGFEALGIDSSEEMIKIAKKSEREGLRFQTLSFQDFSSDEKFDYVIAVFNVLGYFSLNELVVFFKKAGLILEKGGFLIFDFWSDEIKRVKPFQLNLIRTQKGYYLRVVWANLQNRKVQIKYQFFNLNNPLRSFSEKHLIETFSEKTLKNLAELEGLKLVEVKFLSDINQVLFFKK